MTSRIFACAAASAALALAGAAEADVFTPASTTTIFSGPVVVSGAVTLSCTLTITVVTNAAGNDANVTAAALTGGFCAGLPASALPWNVNVHLPLPPPFNITATHLKVFGVTFGPCTGDVIGLWDPTTPQTISFPTGTTVGACSVRGDIEKISGPNLTVTN